MQRQKEKGTHLTKNIADKVFYSVPMLRRKMSSLYSIPETYGVPFSQMQLLALLDECGTTSVTEISNRFGIAKPNITPLIDRMIAAGYVRRDRGTTDRRVVNITIEDAGREKLEQIYAAFETHVASWGDMLDDRELEQLSDSLDSVVNLLAKV